MMTIPRRLILCLAFLLVITPLVSFAAPVKAKTAANKPGSSSKQASTVPATVKGSSSKVTKKKKVKCEDNKEGPCVCKGTTGGSISLRNKNIAVKCTKRGEAFLYTNFADKTSINTGDIKFVDVSA
jgi:hypothetical protein